MKVFLNANASNEWTNLHQYILDSGNEVVNSGPSTDIPFKDSKSLIRQLKLMKELDDLSNSQVMVLASTLTGSMAFDLGYFFGLSTISPKKFINLSDPQIYDFPKIDDSASKFGVLTPTSIKITIDKDMKFSDLGAKLSGIKSNKLKSFTIVNENTTDNYFLGIVVLGIACWYSLEVNSLDIMYCDPNNIDQYLFSELKFRHFRSEDDMLSIIANQE